jgi:hypothetical protein
MADAAHVEVIRQGVEAWNDWRMKEPSIEPDLGCTDLERAFLSGAILNKANLRRADLIEADLSGAHLSWADLRGANLSRANLSEAHLSWANLSFSRLKRHPGESPRETNLSRANLSRAELRWANLSEANLSRADLSGANLSRADLSGANLSGTNLVEADLRGADLILANLVEADLTDADLTGCRIYGISAWGLKVSEKTKQRELLITKWDEPGITVDNIDIAQFIYLLIDNQGIRRVIDAITSKVVLILGRFSKERKPILDAVSDELRKRDLLPVIFDFSVPANRDVTETVKVLAGLARFVIADITDATEVRVELHNIIRDFISLPIQPILLRGQPEFVSMAHLKKFPWLLPSFEYEAEEHLLANLDKRVVDPAEAKVLELRGPQPG